MIESFSPRKLAAALATAALLIGMPAFAEAGPIYDWLSWTTVTGQTATAGSVKMSTTTGFFNPFPIHFDGVPFTPVDAPSLGINNGNDWSFTVDFTGVIDTAGFIVGVGNFAHDLGWTYRLDAFDKTNVAMPLTTLTQIGSYDHTWGPPFGGSFNDDVVLNTATHIFDVTTTAGLDNFNSDILLLSLPANVGRLVISTPNGGGDTVNLLVANAPRTTAPGVPEPATLALVGTGLLGVGARRRRKHTRA